MGKDLFSLLGEPVRESTDATSKVTYAMWGETYDDDDLMPDALLASTKETRVQGETYDDDDLLGHQS